MKNPGNLDPSHYVILQFLENVLHFLNQFSIQAQVNAIKDASLARILCDNADNIQLMQPLAFKRPNDMWVSYPLGIFKHFIVNFLHAGMPRWVAQEKPFPGWS